MDHSPPRGAIPGQTYNQRNNLGKKRYDMSHQGQGVGALINSPGGSKRLASLDWNTQNQINYGAQVGSP